jgi:hypothetical protein
MYSGMPLCLTSHHQCRIASRHAVIISSRRTSPFVSFSAPRALHARVTAPHGQACDPPWFRCIFAMSQDASDVFSLYFSAPRHDLFQMISSL